MLMSLHTIISNQVVSTPRLSGGGQALQSLSMTMTISLMQTMESWGRPGSAPHTHTLIVCCFTSHHSSVMNTLQKLFQVTKRKVLLHYSIFFCIKDLQIDSYYYTFIQLGPDLSWSLKWDSSTTHAHTKNFFNPSKKKIWVNKFSAATRLRYHPPPQGVFDTFPN